jgi:hypothetical protein
VLYIHSRAKVNYGSASAEHEIKPNDRKEDFLPYRPLLFPNAPEVRDLPPDDAAALSLFYDSLQSVADLVNDWYEREGQLPANIFNSILHSADKSLEAALVCVAKFELDRRFPPQPEALGDISSRIQSALASAIDTRKHHIARAEAKAAKTNASPRRGP